MHMLAESLLRAGYSMYFSVVEFATSSCIHVNHCKVTYVVCRRYVCGT